MCREDWEKKRGRRKEGRDRMMNEGTGGRRRGKGGREGWGKEKREKGRKKRDKGREEEREESRK